MSCQTTGWHSVDGGLETGAGNFRDRVGGAAPEEECKAEQFWKAACAEDGYSDEAFARMVQRGAALLDVYGGWQETSEALRAAWRRERGDHLQGVHSSYLDGRVEPELLCYLRRVAEHGVEVRHTGPAVRARAKPHQSAAQHQEEARQKIWDDVTKGRAWAAPSSHAGLEGVTESPQGRVPKMRPDRTLADEGRFINDMRDANLGCDKLNHPPAKLPTHREIARTIL